MYYGYHLVGLGIHSIEEEEKNNNPVTVFVSYSFELFVSAHTGGRDI